MTYFMGRTNDMKRNLIDLLFLQGTVRVSRGEDPSPGPVLGVHEPSSFSKGSSVAGEIATPSPSDDRLLLQKAEDNFFDTILKSHFRELIVHFCIR